LSESKYIKIKRAELIAIINNDIETVNKYKRFINPRCEWCGKEYETSRTDQRCCSKKCIGKLFEKENIESRRTYKREWARKYRLKHDTN